MAHAEQLFGELRKVLEELRQFEVAENLFHWDMEVMMPSAGAAGRGKLMGFLATQIHSRLVSEELGELLEQLQFDIDAGNLDAMQARTVELTIRQRNREVCLPEDLVRETSEVGTASRHAWMHGKPDKDASKFLEVFPRLIELKREEARLTAQPGQSLYDAAHDRFEPGMTHAKLVEVFNPLIEFIDGLMDRIAGSRNPPKPIAVPAPVSKQMEFVRSLVGRMGFDFSGGRLDVSTHPFTCDIHPGDVRITTRFTEKNLLTAISPTVHEAGHGMYEQGLPAEYFGLPVGQVPSLGIHESQSRLWEKLVAQSRSFSDCLAQQMYAERISMLRMMDADELYRALNIVQPNLIRVDSDEITYNIHIYIRMLLESQLMDGSLVASDLRDAWNQLVKKHLGLDVPDDYAGFCQDVHWPSGYFGYFPTYTLGNLYSVQIFDAAKRDIPELEEGFRSGNFSLLLDWLRENIHRHAGLMSADDVVRQATGSGLTAENWLRYADAKYSEVYGL